MGVVEPKPATLRRYGLKLEGWQAIGERQGWVCYVCRRVPKSGRLCIDHEHVRGWKRMPPEERVRFVRGLCCFFCNHYHLARGITVERALRVASYLSEYEARKARTAAPPAP